MKKALVIIIAAIAAISLTASVIAAPSPSSEGMVSFECASMPALNCSMSIKNAISMYYFAPDNIFSICEKEYIAIRNKCYDSPRFIHNGVNVRVLKNDGKNVTIELSVPGYKIIAQDVDWKDLEIMFVGVDE